MIGFYYGTSIPGSGAGEGIYFVKDSNNKYSIYTKRDKNSAAELYGETNELTSKNLDDLWTRIGENFVAKTFTVAGLSMEENITLSDMRSALELQNLAYKSEATGTLTDYVTEVQGASYTPTGTVEVILGYGQTATVISKGSYTPKGSVSGSTTAKGSVSLERDADGFAISGSVSAPNLTIVPSTEKIKQITGVGTLPSYTPAQYTAPSLSSGSGSFATEGVTASIDGAVLKLVPAATANAISSVSLNEGSYTAATFNPGALPTLSEFSVMTGIDSAIASQPTFTGDRISATFTGESSNISAIFTGTEEEIQVSGAYNQAEVESATFEGATATIKPVLKKESKAVTVQ